MVWIGVLVLWQNVFINTNDLPEGRTREQNLHYALFGASEKRVLVFVSNPLETD